MKFLAITALAVCLSEGVLAAPAHGCNGNPARKRDLGFAGGPSKRSATGAKDSIFHGFFGLESGKQDAKASAAKKHSPKGEGKKEESTEKESPKGSSDKEDSQSSNEQRLVFDKNGELAKQTKSGNSTVGKFTQSNKVDELGLSRLLQDNSDDQLLPEAAQFSQTTDVSGGKSEAEKATNKAASTAADNEATGNNGGGSVDSKGVEASGGSGATQDSNEKSASSSDGKQNTADIISNMLRYGGGLEEEG
ncbi:hypothetical protein L249_0398 [Ophiocordyceps polyrhachis-furcata BCC 54312]|uniref:Uncharacterized protein n=1 Tax=Ophiocordyceps polyrhachis-furcata BCC 54312 TaxID=1330021 RepID=A0A367LEI1_9HYPO|nr:hypothetical protein L249_0398 [Ophiocordyceps polyrhachis-furcata BCC 54312]